MHPTNLAPVTRWNVEIKTEQTALILDWNITNLWLNLMNWDSAAFQSQTCSTFLLIKSLILRSLWEQTPPTPPEKSIVLCNTETVVCLQAQRIEVPVTFDLLGHHCCVKSETFPCFGTSSEEQTVLNNAWPLHVRQSFNLSAGNLSGCNAMLETTQS